MCKWRKREKGWNNVDWELWEKNDKSDKKWMTKSDKKMND
jgi:hypothetical protein